jgi:hypothetical protein
MKDTVTIEVAGISNFIINIHKVTQTMEHVMD